MILRACAILSLILVGCGGKPDERLGAYRVQGVPNGVWEKTGADRHPLTGAWQSGCIRWGSSSEKVETRIFDDRTLMIFYFYTDARCQAADFEQGFAVKGQPSFVEARKWSLKIDADSLLDAFLIPNTDKTARGMSDRGMCGVHVWSRNKARSVYTSDCLPKDKSIGTYQFVQAEDPLNLAIYIPTRDSWTELNKRQ